MFDSGNTDGARDRNVAIERLDFAKADPPYPSSRRIWPSAGFRNRQRALNGIVILPYPPHPKCLEWPLKRVSHAALTTIRSGIAAHFRHCLRGQGIFDHRSPPDGE